MISPVMASSTPVSRRLLIALAVIPCLLAAGCAARDPLHRTTPAAAPYRIGLGSCLHQDRAQPILDPIGDLGPDLFVFLGDNIYGDTEDMEVMRAKYGQLANQPGYQRLLRTCPVRATWDDHDFGVNDGGAEYPMKEATKTLMLDFFGVPADAPVRSHPGVYQVQTQSWNGKTIQILLLDTRWFRSPLKEHGQEFPDGGPYTATDDPEATVLGEAQWAWLEQQLRKPADLRLIVSSIQVVSEEHHWEKWMNFPRERGRLFRLIRDTGAGGIVFVSGDRHHAELSAMDAGVGYTLYDLTTSGMNIALKRPIEEANRHLVGEMYMDNNFGVVLLEGPAATPRVRLQIRGEDGNVVIEESIPLASLHP